VLGVSIEMVPGVPDLSVDGDAPFYAKSFFEFIVSASSSGMVLARPKSQILIVHSPLIRIFAGLISRCKILAE
jgi:hypothetical protein